jgi:hypothetical protein
MRYEILLTGLLLMIGLSGKSQQRYSVVPSDTTKVIQFSGVVLSNDSIPLFIPFAHLRVKGRYQGTTSDHEGFFTLAAKGGDTITFSSIGFKSQELIIPDTLKSKGYLVNVFLARDTTLLEEVTLYPWPTPERFKHAFLNMEVNQDAYDLARRNLAIEELKARAYAMGYSAEEMQRYAINMQNQQIYNHNRFYGPNGGAAILGALSNPFSWAQLFDAIKRGDFKR